MSTVETIELPAQTRALADPARWITLIAGLLLLAGLAQALRDPSARRRRWRSPAPAPCWRCSCSCRARFAPDAAISGC